MQPSSIHFACLSLCLSHLSSLHCPCSQSLGGRLGKYVGDTASVWQGEGELRGGMTSLQPLLLNSKLLMRFSVLQDLQLEICERQGLKRFHVSSSCCQMLAFGFSCWQWQHRSKPPSNLQSRGCYLQRRNGQCMLQCPCACCGHGVREHRCRMQVHKGMAQVHVCITS